ncbi:MAG TPA: hypothetical protein VM163_04985 [bacterium]|nr:hypothetical protein [bacterium]
MPQYDFRLEFRLPGQDHINEDAEELSVLNDSGEVTIRLRSGARGSPIKKHSRAALIGGPYPSAADAQTAAERAKRALLLWAVRNRMGIDLGGRPPRAFITSAGLQWQERQIGAPVRAAVHGIDVYEHIDGLVFVALNFEASVGKAARAFVEQVAGAIKTPLAMSPKQELAGEILSASYFEPSDRSRFITRMTAVEALLDPQPRPPAAQDLVARLVEIVNKSGLDDATRAAMSGSLQWLKQESIGQAGRALATRLLPGRIYLELAPGRFFTFCYGLRSSILHSGTVPAEVTDFPSVCAAAHEFVCDLLIASFAEAG